jgi:putative membrane protein
LDAAVMTAADAHFDAQPTASNHFAWMNTQLSLQRTLMSATRTAVSLIGFGFTVAQFFEKLRDSAPPSVRVMRAAGPRDFGLALIAAGVVSLIVFTWQYHVAVMDLRTGEFAAIAGPNQKRSFAPVYIVAVVVTLIGVAAFVTVYMRL